MRARLGGDSIESNQAMDMASDMPMYHQPYADVQHTGIGHIAMHASRAFKGGGEPGYSYAGSQQRQVAMNTNHVIHRSVVAAGHAEAAAYHETHRQQVQGQPNYNIFKSHTKTAIASAGPSSFGWDSEPHTGSEHPNAVGSVAALQRQSPGIPAASQRADSGWALAALMHGASSLRLPSLPSLGSLARLESDPLLSSIPLFESGSQPELASAAALAGLRSCTPSPAPSISNSARVGDSNIQNNSAAEYQAQFVGQANTEQANIAVGSSPARGIQFRPPAHRASRFARQQQDVQPSPEPLHLSQPLSKQEDHNRGEGNNRDTNLTNHNISNQSANAFAGRGTEQGLASMHNTNRSQAAVHMGAMGAQQPKTEAQEGVIPSPDMRATHPPGHPAGNSEAAAMGQDRAVREFTSADAAKIALSGMRPGLLNAVKRPGPSQPRISRPGMTGHIARPALVSPFSGAAAVVDDSSDRERDKSQTPQSIGAHITQPPMSTMAMPGRTPAVTPINSQGLSKPGSPGLPLRPVPLLASQLTGRADSVALLLEAATDLLDEPGTGLSGSGSLNRLRSQSSAGLASASEQFTSNGDHKQATGRPPTPGLKRAGSAFTPWSGPHPSVTTSAGPTAAPQQAMPGGQEASYMTMDMTSDMSQLVSTGIPATRTHRPHIEMPAAPQAVGVHGLQVPPHPTFPHAGDPNAMNSVPGNQFPAGLPVPPSNMQPLPMLRPPPVLPLSTPPATAVLAALTKARMAAQKEAEKAAAPRPGRPGISLPLGAMPQHAPPMSPTATQPPMGNAAASSARNIRSGGPQFPAQFPPGQGPDSKPAGGPQNARNRPAPASNNKNGASLKRGRAAAPESDSSDAEDSDDEEMDALQLWKETVAVLEAANVPIPPNLSIAPQAGTPKPPQPPNARDLTEHLPPDQRQAAMARIRREKNRLAARKCRAKKVICMAETQERLKALNDSNQELRTQLAALQRLFAQEAERREALKAIFCTRWLSEPAAVAKLTAVLPPGLNTAHDIIAAIESGVLQVDPILQQLQPGQQRLSSAGGDATAQPQLPITPPTSNPKSTAGNFPVTSPQGPAGQTSGMPHSVPTPMANGPPGPTSPRGMPAEVPALLGKSVSSLLMAAAAEPMKVDNGPGPGDMQHDQFLPGAAQPETAVQGMTNAGLQLSHHHGTAVTATAAAAMVAAIRQQAGATETTVATSSAALAHAGLAHTGKEQKHQLGPGKHASVETKDELLVPRGASPAHEPLLFAAASDACMLPPGMSILNAASSIMPAASLSLSQTLPLLDRVVSMRHGALLQQHNRTVVESMSGGSGHGWPSMGRLDSLDALLVSMGMGTAPSATTDNALPPLTAMHHHGASLIAAAPAGPIEHETTQAMEPTTAADQAMEQQPATATRHAVHSLPTVWSANANVNTGANRTPFAAAACNASSQLQRIPARPVTAAPPSLSIESRASLGLNPQVMALPHLKKRPAPGSRLAVVSHAENHNAQNPDSTTGHEGTGTMSTHQVAGPKSPTRPMHEFNNNKSNKKAAGNTASSPVTDNDTTPGAKNIAKVPATRTGGPVLPLPMLAGHRSAFGNASTATVQAGVPMSKLTPALPSRGQPGQGSSTVTMQSMPGMNSSPTSPRAARLPQQMMTETGNAISYQPHNQGRPLSPTQPCFSMPQSMHDVHWAQGQTQHVSRPASRAESSTQ